jgi:hypothetical protein
MFTYDVVSKSCRKPQELAEELTKRSANGWEVIQITYDGADRYNAFIRHAGNVPLDTPVESSETNRAPMMTSQTVQPVATASSPSSAATGATPNVPADWHKDPSGRFELRYWNGTAWTEHVATGGKQSIDPIR